MYHTFERQLDDTDYLLLRGVREILILIVILRIVRVEDQQFIDGSSIDRSKTRLLAD